MSREKDGERIIGEDRGARLNFFGKITTSQEKLLFTPRGLLMWFSLTNEVMSFMQMYV